MQDAPGALGGRRALTRAATAATVLTWRAARPQVLLLVVTAVAGAVAPVAAAWLTSAVLDRVVSAGPGGALLALAAGLAVAGVLVAVLPQVEQYLHEELTRTTSFVATARLYAAMDRFVGLSHFEDPAFLDRLRLAGEGTRAPAKMVNGSLVVLRSLLALAGFIGALLLLSPVMTAVVLAAAGPTLVAELALSRRRAAMTLDITPAERRELFYSELLCDADAAKEIRLFGIGAFLRARMLVERRGADASRRTTDRRELRVQGGLALLSAGIAGTGLMWAVAAARGGTLSVGDVSLFILAVGGVQTALGGAIAELAQVHHHLLTFGYLRDVLTARTDLPVAARPRAVAPLRHGIELRDVWFRYSPKHRWALQAVDLDIPAGAALALVGRNGAGKSTLVKLLCRFYDPTKGVILWDGIDMRELDPAALRARMTAVFQDFVEYDLTAAENIGLGDVAAVAERERIRAAARRAGVHDELAALPAGFDTLLSRIFLSEADRADPHTGVVLSGGQWQRIALARAFMRDRRDVMILDEPSAGLDAEAEHEIHAGLRRYRAGRTSVLISHRLGAVRDSDRIVVLDEGSVVEQGTHEALLAVGGTYARLFRMQASGYSGTDDQAMAGIGEPPS